MDKFKRYNEIMQTEVDGVNGALKFVMQLIVDIEERVGALENGSRKVITNKENKFYTKGTRLYNTLFSRRSRG